MKSINNTLEKWLNDLENFSLKDYERFPDIDLYMDQLITYLEREFQIYQTSSLDKLITPSMINNYVKGDVMIAPKAKKYNREHMALIKEIITLKQVLPLTEVKQILDLKYRSDDNINYQDVYNEFNNLVNEKNKIAINEAKEALANIEENNLEELTDLANNFAITAISYINISKRILFLRKVYELMQEEKTEE